MYLFKFRNCTAVATCFFPLWNEEIKKDLLSVSALANVQVS